MIHFRAQIHSPRSRVIAGIACSLALACGPRGENARPPTADTPESSAARAGGDEPVLEVVTTPVRRGAIVQRISAPGSLVARRESDIGTQVSGRITRIYVQEADRVETGDPLFEVDAEPYRVALRQANAGLDLARSERKQLEADVARANELKRREVLSQQEVERITTRLDVAGARERQAAETVSHAKQNLEWTTVRAPYTGSVSERRADEGTTAQSQPQTIVVVLQETDVLEARVTIPESQLMLVREGDPALLHVEGMPGPVQTEVASVADTIDPASRTYMVRMNVDNADHALKAGVFVRAEIIPSSKQEVLLLPREAVHTEDGQTRVLRVHDGRAVEAPVALGVVSEDSAEILRGLRVDDEVILRGVTGPVAPGMQVRAVRAAEASGGGPAS